MDYAMPNINFSLPHWLYWAMLAIFPLVMAGLVARERRQRERPRVSLPLAVLFWLTAGFVGMHRFYLRNAWGLLYIPLFLAILWLNAEARDARGVVSAARQDMEIAASRLHRARPPTPELEQRASSTAAAFQAARQAQQDREQRAGWGAGLMALLLLVDAALLPGMVRRRDKFERATLPPPQAEPPLDDRIGAVCADLPQDSRLRPFVYAVDQISRYSGRFVAAWSVIAVFAYFYEVIARYVFNSPTNWVHESQFLMFGMLYMLAGAYAFRDDSHVRVDVLYFHFPRRGKALADILSSTFFFIFTITILVTGWRFAADAMAFGETSFTEWGIQYWVVKLALPVGAALIVLQGLARLLKDLAILTGKA